MNISKVSGLFRELNKIGTTVKLTPNVLYSGISLSGTKIRRSYNNNFCPALLEIKNLILSSKSLMRNF